MNTTRPPRFRADAVMQNDPPRRDARGLAKAEFHLVDSVHRARILRMMKSHGKTGGDAT
jgi:hypothetical protein